MQKICAAPNCSNFIPAHRTYCSTRCLQRAKYRRRGIRDRDLAVTQTVEPPDPTVQSTTSLDVLRYIQSQHIANVNKSPTRITREAYLTLLKDEVHPDILIDNEGDIRVENGEVVSDIYFMVHREHFNQPTFKTLQT